MSTRLRENPDNDLVTGARTIRIFRNFLTETLQLDKERDLKLVNLHRLPQHHFKLRTKVSYLRTKQRNADDGANGANGLRYCTAALKLFLRRAALSGASRLENLRVHRCFLA